MNILPRTSSKGVDIRIVAVNGPSVEDPDVRRMIDFAADILSINESDLMYLARRCMVRGRPYVVVNSVTVGFAYDFLEAMKSCQSCLEFDTRETPYNRIKSRPLTGESMRLLRKNQSLTRQLDVYYSELYEARQKLQAAEYLAENLRQENKALRKHSEKLERGLPTQFKEVRVDPNDGDVYIVRPTSAVEIRQKGSLYSETISIVFQIPKALFTERSRNRGDENLFQRHCYLSEKRLRRALDKATRPNPRGKIRASVHIIRMLDEVVSFTNRAEIDQMHEAKLESRLRRSDFNW